ncbi:MAG: VWA domain-containing protein, partial [Candidatus Riflebacteria bacterium]
MKFSFKPEFKAIPVGGNSQFHVLTSFSVPASSGISGIQRTPISIALVIDCSGSMQGAKLDQTINAILEITHSLTRRDRLAIVAFDTNVKVISELKYLTEKSEVAEKVRTITAGSSTNLSGGWLEGLDQLESAFDTDHINRVFLLTDGQANCGITEAGELARIGSTFLGKGISTSTFGFGNDFNESLLSAIARNSGGNFYFVQRAEDVSTAFRNEFGEVLDLAGQNCKIFLELAEGVELCEDISLFSSTRNGNLVTWTVGDINSELDYELIFRLNATVDNDLKKLKL